ncbi:uncharacterized protein CBL_04255 [Carabus blaptoides fortunei]
MSKFVHCAVFTVATLLLLNESSASIQIITGLIQRNVFGVPMLHEAQNWPFDPEAGMRRSTQYQQENGIRGEKAIEQLGLGIDGNQERRLVQQHKRDEGHLGGLNFFRP